jgi:2-haloacid dehalogenase
VTDTRTRDRWITFDCFGTLVDWHHGFAAIIGPLAGQRTADVLQAYHRFERLLEQQTPHRSYRDVLTAALQRAAEDVGITVSEADARRLPSAWGTQPVFEDVEPMLASLRKSGCRLGVLTNCDEDLFEMTQRAFRVRFDLVVTAERVRDYKPSLAHFRYFARTTGAGPDNWMHVACSWYHDIAPARELGVRRVWLDRDRSGEDRSSASAYVQSAAAVPDAIARLWSR